MKWILRVALSAVVALTVLAVAILVLVPILTHGAALTVLSGSMTPQIPVGAVVVDRPVDPATLQVGDVATYQRAPGVAEYVTHRIVAVHRDTTPITFTFKGDANRVADLAAVPATAIRGKVWFHVPYLGSLRESLQAPGLGGLAVIAAIVLLGGYAFGQLAGGVGDELKRREERPGRRRAGARR